MTGKFAAIGLAVEKPFRVELVHPTKGTPLVDKDGNVAYVDMLSSDSKRARQINDAQTDRRIGSKIRTTQTAAAIRANQDDLLAGLTVGWYLLDLDGNPLDIPFSESNARELYGNDAAIWVRDQADTGAATRANFMPKPPNTSTAS